MRRILLSSVAISLGLLAGCVAHPGAVLEVNDSGRQLSVQRGEKVAIHLVANHSTGYHWVYIDMTGAVVKQVGSMHYSVPRSDIVGGEGVETWSFQAVQRGQGVLHFEYRRSWENKGVPAEKTISYSIEVK